MNITINLKDGDVKRLSEGQPIEDKAGGLVVRIEPSRLGWQYCIDCEATTKRMPDGRCMECMRHGRAPAHEPSPPEIGADPQRELACNIVKIRERVLEHGQCLRDTTTNLGRLLSQVADLEHQLCEHEHRGPQGSDLRG